MKNILVMISFLVMILAKIQIIYTKETKPVYAIALCGHRFIKVWGMICYLKNRGYNTRKRENSRLEGKYLV